jgi:hypothetical protein
MITIMINALQWCIAVAAFTRNQVLYAMYIL